MEKKILIVDDTKFMRKMLADCLTKNGYEVAGEASHGREAIQLYEELRPDVVMMDINMPEMSGIEAIKEILRIDSSAVILVCSAANQQTLIFEAMEAGAKGYIMKPFKPHRVLDIIRKYAEPHVSPQSNESSSTNEVVFAANSDPEMAEEPKYEEQIVERNSEELSSETESESEQSAEDPISQEHLVDSEQPVNLSIQTHTIWNPNIVDASFAGHHVDPSVSAKSVSSHETERTNMTNDYDQNAKSAYSLGRNGSLRSFVSSMMCNWQEEINGETATFTVVCTESENKVLIEMTGDNQVKHTMQFTIDGLLQLSGWLENHISQKKAV